MKANNLLGQTLALTLGLANSAAIGAEGETPAMMKPLMATSHASGSKHILSFFVTANDACNLTVMISELRNDQLEPTGPSPMMQMVIDPFKSAHVDIVDGKSLEFMCGRAASTMTVVSIDRVSYLER